MFGVSVTNGYLWFIHLIDWNASDASLYVHILLFAVFSVLLLLSWTRYRKSHEQWEQYLAIAFGLGFICTASVLLLNATMALWDFPDPLQTKRLFAPLGHVAFGTYLVFLALGTLAGREIPTPSWALVSVIAVGLATALVAAADFPDWWNSFRPYHRYVYRTADLIIYSLLIALCVLVGGLCYSSRKTGTLPCVPFLPPWCLLFLGQLSSLCYGLHWLGWDALWGVIADMSLLLHVPALLLTVALVDRRRWELAMLKDRRQMAGLIDALLTLTRSNVPEIQAHSERNAQLASTIAERMGMSEREAREVYWAAILHDLGKLSLDRTLLSLPRNLTPSEWKEVKRHPKLGADVIRHIEGLGVVADDILAHHERWDGSGYPRGLRGREIPLGARIVGLIDAFDAMISVRPYARARSLMEAAREVQSQAGRHFDPAVVEAFFEVIEEKGVPLEEVPT
jgi:HD-GYP domain-containing protein (c-di-GMP phosphodiesterase class II)